MKYDSLHLAVMDVLQEKKITHPNQQAIDVHEPEKDEITAADFKKLRSMKKTPSGKLHNCATHIEHTEYGEGVCIKEAHADPDDNGDIAWYTVQFADGAVRKVQTESMTIVASESHKHESAELEGEQLEEARFKKGQDVGKPGMNFKKIAAKAAAKYGSAEAGKRVAGAVLKKVLAKEEVEQVDEIKIQTAVSAYKKMSAGGNDMKNRTGLAGDQSDRLLGRMKKKWGEEKTRKAIAKEEVEQDEQVGETIELHDSFTIEMKEKYTFGDYLTAAKKLVGEEQAINLANEAFNTQNIDIFIEQFSASAVEDKVKAHMAAGHKVSMPKYSTRDGKPRAEYIVTDKESGVRRRYIHQGNVTKMENMGAKGKKD